MRQRAMAVSPCGKRRPSLRVSDRHEVVVKCVHERNASRDVELGDGVVGDAVEVLDQRAQGVAVRGNQHLLVGPDGRCDLVVPSWHEARDGILEALGQRERLRGEVGVSGQELR